jgi:hypothetical protein
VLTPETTSRAEIRKARDVFVLASATKLAIVSPFIREANAAHHLRALLLRADVDCAWILPMLERANLRSPRNTLVHSSPDVPRRVLRAWQHRAQHQLIADATVVGDRLFVRSCSLEPFEIRFCDLPALARLSEEERAHFSIDEDGSYLHWTGGDLHVGLDMIRYGVDEDFRIKTNLRRLAAEARFGGAVKTLRTAEGLRQSDIPGLSAKQVSRIEAGQGTPRVKTIQKLAHAIGASPQAYLDRVAEELSGELPAARDPRRGEKSE